VIVGKPVPTGVVEVAAGLVFHDGKLLITQRPTTGHLANLWEFPGGKRERDESFEECLHRELAEELAIEVDELQLIESVEHTYPEKTVHLKFFHCTLAAGSPKAVGCQNFRWVNQNELSEFQFPAADEQLIGQLKSRRDLWSDT
jgi:8-oxo-dGTP diphosphatase